MTRSQSAADPLSPHTTTQGNLVEQRGERHCARNAVTHQRAVSGNFFAGRGCRLQKLLVGSSLIRANGGSARTTRPARTVALCHRVEKTFVPAIFSSAMPAAP